MALIEISYRCGCMSAFASIYVEERGAGEDLMIFMGRVQEALGSDHRKKRPICTATTVDEVKIPFEQETVGKGPRRH